MRLRLLPLLLLVPVAMSCIRTFDRRNVAPVDRQMRWELFDHGRHQAVMINMELSCMNCHPNRPTLAKVLPNKWNGKTYSCHDCHRNPTMLAIATQKCNLCHKDLEPYRPVDHRLDWRNRHALFAGTQAMKCATCHASSECVACHLARNTIQQTAHPRTVMYYHSVEARSDPHKCGSCHQLAYCRDCHLKKGVEF